MSPVHWLLDAVLSDNSSARNSSSHRGRSLHTKVGFSLDDNNYRRIMPIMLMSDDDYWLWPLWCLRNFSKRRIQNQTRTLHILKKRTKMMPLAMSTFIVMQENWGECHICCFRKILSVGQLGSRIQTFHSNSFHF